jgi:hypothetical protein
MGDGIGGNHADALHGENGRVIPALGKSFFSGDDNSETVVTA